MYLQDRTEHAVSYTKILTSDSFHGVCFCQHQQSPENTPGIARLNLPLGLTLEDLVTMDKFIALQPVRRESQCSTLRYTHTVIIVL